MSFKAKGCFLITQNNAHFCLFSVIKNININKLKNDKKISYLFVDYETLSLDLDNTDCSKTVR